MKTLIQIEAQATTVPGIGTIKGVPRPNAMLQVFRLVAILGLLLMSGTGYAQKGQLVRGQIESQGLTANLYGDSSVRPYLVYLPPSYDRTTHRYPVIYALHGYGDNEATLTTQSPAVPSPIPATLDSMIVAREIGEVIVVFVCATNRLYGSFYLNSAVIGDYESYIAADLVRQIDATYRTIAARESRGIVGYSMGAWGAAHLALKFPNVFSVLVAQAGFYDSQSAWFDGISRLLAGAIPATLEQFDTLAFPNNAAQALFAGLIPNTQRPPLFSDYPYEMVAGRLTTNTAAMRTASERDVQNGDLQRYAAQPVKLAAIKIVHGTQDPVAPAAGALSFANALATEGISAAYEPHSGGHIFRADLALPYLVTNLIGAQNYTELAAGRDLNVPADFPSIQAAVDAAQANDTIHIAPGVYSEQVHIRSKKLTIIGQPGTILRATPEMSPFADFLHIPIIGIRLSQVALKGLIFEGDHLAGRFIGIGNLQGIQFWQGSGSVENCAFYGFRESTPGTEFADAIAVYNPADPEVSVSLIGNTFADNYRGVYFTGASSRKTIHFTIEDNTFIGPGPLSVTATTAVFVNGGAGGRIVGNTISRFSYVGPEADFPISFGILAANLVNAPAFGVLQPIVLEGNILRNNQMHIALIKGDGSEVRNNRFQGTAPGPVPAGLAVTGTNVTIASNQFEDMEEGVRLMGNDPNFGTVLGFAVDAQVLSNRFCGVDNNIAVQSLASGTQQGTLSCPFPPPEVTISPAVVLSWPEFEEDYLVESAPVASGQWSVFDAIPFRGNGNHTVTVPTSEEHRFFRLRKAPQP